MGRSTVATPEPEAPDKGVGILGRLGIGARRRHDDEPKPQWPADDPRFKKLREMLRKKPGNPEAEQKLCDEGPYNAQAFRSYVELVERAKSIDLTQLHAQLYEARMSGNHYRVKDAEEAIARANSIVMDAAIVQKQWPQLFGD